MRCLTILPLVCLLFLCCSCFSFQKNVGAKQKPNIVLINVDDLGWKDLGFMGSQYYETPHLDAFAQVGMVFTRAYAGAANCAPSRACLFSGLNTPRHGVYTVSPSERGDARTRKIIPVKNTPHLADTTFTLARMLKSAGYVTGTFGKWHIGKDPKLQGLDYNVGGSTRGNPGKDGYFSPYKIDHIKNGPDGEYLTDRLTDEAIEFLTNHRDTAFFLYLPFYTVHTPIMGKEALIKKFEQKAGVDGQDNPTYAAMINAMDYNVGRLLDALEQLDLVENTLVIFTSDNGGIRSISEQNPLRAGKGSYYEGGIRVPLVIRWPGKIGEGVKNENQVSQLDLFPTLQEIVQPQKKAGQLDGQSLRVLFHKDTTIARDLFFHFPVYLEAYNKKEDDGRDPLFRTRPGSVVLSGDWKLHEYFEDNGLELYHLASDPGERNNLLKDQPEKVEILYDKLKAWRQKTKAPVPTELNPLYDPS